ncbi:DUF5818 domain-containing protein [uncultured Sphingomonas sp.]|uniref:DUF5818 domain-containing protein n=1 Tax=uncultured Sphingomonas sp. TaxID=158754 RepID=UPI002599CDF8|nr:DUF5818 domain-containing protein [uncultured Sphingomonas sp.]
MPRGTRHMLTGTLHWDESNRSYVLHAKDGGCWFVDMPWRSRRLIGREVTVEGVRSGFNLLDAVRIRDGAAKQPRSRHRSALAGLMARQRRLARIIGRLRHLGRSCRLPRGRGRRLH